MKIKSTFVMLILSGIVVCASGFVIHIITKRCIDNLVLDFQRNSVVLADDVDSQSSDIKDDTQNQKSSNNNRKTDNKTSDKTAEKSINKDVSENKSENKTGIVSPVKSNENNLSNNSSYKYYKIVWGDTLSEISIRENVDMTTLAKINNIKNINLIYAGDTMKIPVK